MKRRVSLHALLAVLVSMLVIAGLQPVAVAQTKTWKLRIQGSWPTGAYVFRNLRIFAEQVEKMSGGRLVIEPLPAGAIVGAFEVLDAAHRGVIDGGHTCSYYFIGKHKAATLFTGAPGGPFGMDFLDFFGWMYYGGGWELLQELYQKVIGLNIVAFPMIPSGPQAMGWFKKPISGVADLKGLKYRVPGIAGDVYKEMGMSIVVLPGAEIVPAAERGVIDATEWAVPAEDVSLGIHDIWKTFYTPGMHEPTTTCELQLSKAVWDQLPADLQQILKTATAAMYMHWWALLTKASAETLKEMVEKHGVKVYKTPRDIYPEFLKVWDRLAAQEAAKDPFFKKVLDSQRQYAALVVPYRRLWNDALRFAADYYWPEEK
ncbi:MAG: exported solute-binding protein [Candidatus Tectimicrobiota bacterium]|nr:MAG: exported solute-binding protein [Candidatus Tectomicrobia bacterium]